MNDAELKRSIDAYNQAGGNLSEAARALGIPRQTLQGRLRTAGVLRPTVHGRIDPSPVQRLALPRKGHIKRFIFTSAQNNTLLHPGWKALLRYAEWLDKQPRSSCSFHVGTFSYALDAFGSKAREHMWFAPELEPYMLLDRRVELAPSLVWCGEMNIIPTTRYPLSGLETYNGRQSNIVPHAKITMDSIPALKGEGAKLNFSTGTITQRNYIQRRAGIIAEQGHSYGGLLVEIDSEGAWFVRQLHIGAQKEVYDIGPEPLRPLRITSAHGVDELECVEAIVWGDIHAIEMEPWIRDLGWGAGGMLDALRPRFQFMHDIFSMRSQSPHEWRNFHSDYAKYLTGGGSVEAEVVETADFLNQANRAWCQTYVVPSNHDRHLERWLNEFDPRKDVANARYFYKLQALKLELIEKGENPAILEWALRDAGLHGNVRFLAEDESFVICEDVDGGIECGLHGDRGPGGARGSTRNLGKLGRAVTKGHDHVAAIRDNVYSVGVCAENLGYVKGPLSHSASHVVTYWNGARQIVTMWKGKWRL